ncbi:MAG: hypothetical protein AAGN35_17950 [Bacteroidota bacterium]
MNAFVIKNVLLIALTSFILSACQITEAPPQAAPTAQLSTQCNEGELRSFDLDQVSPSFYGSYDYAFQFEPDLLPWLPDGCSCIIKHFTIPFSNDLPDRHNIEVEDEEGNGVRFTIVSDPFAGTKSIFIDNGDVQTERSIFLIRFLTPVIPNVVGQPGGLCIVDNIDGNDHEILGSQVPGGLYNTPVFIFETPVEKTSTPRIGIPMIATTPY